MILPRYIPLSWCEHGHLYRIHSRNLSLGVFRENVGGFVGIREKFGDRYLFTEFSWDHGPPFGTVQPLEDLGPCPITDLRETTGSYCGTCKAPVHFVEFKSGEKVKTYRFKQPNGTVKTWDAPIGGRWRHVEKPTSRCRKIIPYARHNEPLFDWLKAKEAELDSTN